MSNLYRCALVTLVFLFFVGHFLPAQSPTDGLMMKRGQLCNLLQYQHSSWKEYWEGEKLRENQNLGTVTTQSVMLMSALGITSRLNVMAALPFIWTGTSASYLAGQNGIQDLNLWLKWRAYDFKMGSASWSLFGTGGFSTPLSNYVPDFLPLSIGMQSTNFSGRIIVYGKMPTGWYATAQGGYTWRSNIRIDRDAYLANGQYYYTNEVDLPNVMDATLRIGYLNTKVQAEVLVDRFQALKGDDIRYNDAPFPTNRMEGTSMGAMVKYWFTPRWAVQAAGSRVIAGRNIGQSNIFSGGVFYLLQAFDREKKS